MKHIIIVAMLLAPGFVQADYKCTKDGRTYYSNSPWCEEEGGPPQSTASKNGLSSGSAIEIGLGKELCREQAPRKVRWKDPQSVRIEGVEGGDVVTIKHSGNKVLARQYIVRANAKNSFGAYGGASMILCYTTEDGNRLLNTIYLPG